MGLLPHLPGVARVLHPVGRPGHKVARDRVRSPGLWKRLLKLLTLTWHCPSPGLSKKSAVDGVWFTIQMPPGSPWEVMDMLGDNKDWLSPYLSVLGN